jgi:hypothetical protein
MSPNLIFLGRIIAAPVGYFAYRRKFWAGTVVDKRLSKEKFIAMRWERWESRRRVLRAYFCEIAQISSPRGQWMRASCTPTESFLLPPFRPANSPPFNNSAAAAPVSFVVRISNQQAYCPLVTWTYLWAQEGSNGDYTNNKGRILSSHEDENNLLALSRINNS